jgi:hypothetical protein
MQLKNNTYGIRVNKNSSFIWNNDLSETGISEPKISIKDCKITCIDVSSSVFYLSDDAGSPKRKQLELTSVTTASTLITVVNSGEFTLDHIQNNWCNAGGFAIAATDNGKFRYLRKDTTKEAFANCTNTTGHTFHNYAFSVPANSNSCEPGSFLKNNMCYAQIGYGYIGTDNAVAVGVPTLESIGTDADISHW